MSESNQDGGKSELGELLWLSIFLPLLTILVGIVLGEVQTNAKIGWAWLTVATIMVFGLNLIFIWQVSHPIKKTLAQLKRDLVVQQFHAQHNWMMDGNQLASYERNVDAKEIWLISSDLLEDTQGGQFMEVVKLNLVRKIQYVYFFSNTVENRLRVETIRSAHHSELVEYIPLPDSFFFLVPKLDIVIYNPRGLGGLSKSAFMGVPVPEESSHYHVAVSVDFIDKSVGTLLDSYQKRGNA